jgi:hypothetical protein
MKYGYDIAPPETREAVIKSIDFISAHSKLKSLFIHLL